MATSTGTPTLRAPPALSTGTPISTFAIPTPTPVPTFLAWDVPPKTGITHLDAIIAAVIAGDATKLEPYVTGAVMGCLSQEVQCPAGIPLYTPVPALESGACPGEGSWVRLSDVQSRIRLPRTNRRGDSRTNNCAICRRCTRSLLELGGTISEFDMRSSCNDSAQMWQGCISE